MYPYLFSSQIPFFFTSDSSLKFVEIHQEFLRHQWLHDIRLGDRNCLTTWPLSRVFSRVLKRAELVQLACFVNIIPWTRIKKTIFLSPITRQNMRKMNRDLRWIQEYFLVLHQVKLKLKCEGVICWILLKGVNNLTSGNIKSDAWPHRGVLTTISLTCNVFK